MIMLHNTNALLQTFMLVFPIQLPVVDVFPIIPKGSRLEARSFSFFRAEFLGVPE
jgi:hypothetical protein